MWKFISMILGINSSMWVGPQSQIKLGKCSSTYPFQDVQILFSRFMPTSRKDIALLHSHVSKSNAIFGEVWVLKILITSVLYLTAIPKTMVSLRVAPRRHEAVSSL